MTNVVSIPQQVVTIVSFYAFRYVQWSGVDYDDCLGILDASCKRLGLRHVCLSDAPRPNCETFIVPGMPENLMQAFLFSQAAWLRHYTGPTMFTGADCLITRDPTEVCFGYDMAITTRHYTHINTGAVWCYSPKCIEAFENGLALEPIAWGEDQTCLLSGIRKTPDLRLRELPMRDYNGKPKTTTEMLDRPPMVAHFKGDRKRKDLMRPWYENFLKQHGEPVKAAA